MKEGRDRVFANQTILSPTNVIFQVRAKAQLKLGCRGALAPEVRHVFTFRLPIQLGYHKEALDLQSTRSHREGGLVGFTATKMSCSGSQKAVTKITDTKSTLQ